MIFVFVFFPKTIGQDLKFNVLETSKCRYLVSIEAAYDCVCTSEGYPCFRGTQINSTVQSIERPQLKVAFFGDQGLAPIYGGENPDSVNVLV